MGIILIDPAWAGFYLRRTAKYYYLQDEKGAFPECVLELFYLKRSEGIVDLGKWMEM